MKRLKRFTETFFIVILLTSCRTSINKDQPVINLEENTNLNNNLEKKRIEIKFSCGENGISEYLDDGWTILKENSEEKICTWKSFPASKDCNMEKDKGCKITKPDKIGKRKFIYQKNKLYENYKIRRHYKYDF